MFSVNNGTADREHCRQLSACHNVELLQQFGVVGLCKSVSAIKTDVRVEHPYSLQQLAQLEQILLQP
jgi:hypothetical protein